MTGQLIHKPIGVELTKEKLQKCFKNNERYISVAFSFEKNGTKYWNKYQFEKLSLLEADDCFDNLISKDSDCIIFFNGAYNMKPAELPFYAIEARKDWFWYALEGICSTFPTSSEGDCFYNNFLKTISPEGAYSLWKKLGESNKIGRTIGIKQGIVSRFGTWIEEDGIFYSNADHNKKPFEYGYQGTSHRGYTTPTTTAKVDNISSLNYPEVHTIGEGLLAAKAGEGLLKYYTLFHTYPNLVYIDDVTSEKYKKAGLMPMDFVKLVQTEDSTIHAPGLDYLKSYLSTYKKVIITVVRFINCEKTNRTEAIIEISNEPKIEKNEEVVTLKPGQKKYILTKLNVALVMAENDCDEAVAMELIREGHSFADELSAREDCFLIERAKEHKITGWISIHS
jgi:hypothetical protein